MRRSAYLLPTQLNIGITVHVATWPYLARADSKAKAEGYVEGRQAEDET